MSFSPITLTYHKTWLSGIIFPLHMPHHDITSLFGFVAWAIVEHLLHHLITIMKRCPYMVPWDAKSYMKKFILISMHHSALGRLVVQHYWPSITLISTRIFHLWYVMTHHQLCFNGQNSTQDPNWWGLSTTPRRKNVPRDVRTIWENICILDNKIRVY